jgi:DNA-binding NarL/FixJ family response regulator
MNKLFARFGIATHMDQRRPTAKQSKVEPSPSEKMRPANYFHEIAMPASGVGKLTRREQEVLELLASGFLYKEISDELGITLPTVKSHLSQIYGKLRVRTRTEATVRFLAAK